LIRFTKRGSIDDFLQRFDDTVGHSSASLEYFKKQIRYYDKNKKAKPFDKSRPWYNVDFKAGDELKDVHPNYIFGGLEIACACLIAVLPFPGCKALAASLASDGFLRMGGQWFEETDEENKRKNENTKQSMNVFSIAQ